MMYSAGALQVLRSSAVVNVLTSSAWTLLLRRVSRLNGFVSNGRTLLFTHCALLVDLNPNYVGGGCSYDIFTEVCFHIFASAKKQFSTDSRVSYQ